MWKLKFARIKFGTWIWKKLSNTGLLLNFNAFMSQNWEKSLTFVFSVEQKLSVQRTIFSK